MSADVWEDGAYDICRIDLGRTLRVRLTAATLACIMAGALVWAALIWSESVRYEGMLARQASDIAKLTSYAADREIGTSMARLEALSHAPALLAGDLAAFHHQLATTPNSDGTWFLLLNADHQLIDMRSPVLPTPIAPLPPWQPDMRADVEAMLASRMPLIGDRRWAPAAKTFAVALHLPVVVNGDPRHSLAVVIPDDHMKRAFEATGLAPGWIGAIFDRHGAVIACVTAPADAGSAEMDGPCPLRGSSEPGLVSSGSPADVTRTFVSKLSGWTFAASVPRAIGLAPAGRDLTILASAVALACLVLVPAVWLLSARLVRSVEALRLLALHALSRNAALQERHAIYWNQSSDGLYVVGWTRERGFRMEAANDAYQRIQGRCLSDLVGKRPWDGLSSDGISVAKRALEACMRTGAPQAHQQSITAHGVARACEVRLNLVPGRGGAGGVILLAHVCDISDANRARDAFRRLSGRLLNLQDEERRRLARELHDSTSQLLLAATLAAMRVRSKLADMMPSCAASLDEVVALVERSQQEIRTTAYMLHPPLLEEMGLPTALRWYSAGVAKRSGVETRVDISAEAERWRASKSCETALFRIVQEATLNANRHSGCRTIWLRLSLVDNPEPGAASLMLEVEDDGRGLPPELRSHPDGRAEGPELGVGLTGMRERIAQLGGRLELRNATSRGGTLVRVAIPTESVSLLA